MRVVDLWVAGWLTGGGNGWQCCVVEVSHAWLFLLFFWAFLSHVCSFVYACKRSRPKIVVGAEYELLVTKMSAVVKKNLS
jgi:hypothetical protein